ncbi:thiamine-phosphate kinase [Pseudonocardia acaciae]|uniref:thiamine-phosphate kinase n=1 Tax=Pseudonocardia acaciae TaxID=551276 RepID=UPI00048DDFBB|nr:thiamine-phosphate kinase [Pseudonocardia acaciae]
MADRDPARPATVADLGEFGLIARVTAGRVQPPGTLLGPGDDAAVLATPDGRVLASTDMLVEGVHFRLDWSTPVQVGRKAAAVNMADVSAMGAVPTALLVAIGCPPETPASLVEGLTEGLWAEAAATGAGVVGGDVVSAPEVVVSVTVLGDLAGRSPVTRSGARPGDVLAVAGRLGRSAAGLAALSSGRHAADELAGELAGELADVVAAHRVPAPPYSAGPAAARAGATAMIDVSDGLLADVGHVALASSVAVDVRAAALPVAPELARAAAALGADPLRWLLTGGEDHALAATFPAGIALPALPEGWTPVGTVRAGAGVTVDGEPYDGAAGWDHFSAR